MGFDRLLHLQSQWMTSNTVWNHVSSNCAMQLVAFTQQLQITHVNQVCSQLLPGHEIGTTCMLCCAWQAAGGTRIVVTDSSLLL